MEVRAQTCIFFLYFKQWWSFFGSMIFIKNNKSWKTALGTSEECVWLHSSEIIVASQHESEAVMNSPLFSSPFLGKELPFTWFSIRRSTGALSALATAYSRNSQKSCLNTWLQICMPSLCTILSLLLYLLCMLSASTSRTDSFCLIKAYMWSVGVASKI